MSAPHPMHADEPRAEVHTELDVTAAEELELVDGLEDEPRSRRRLIAPVALVAGLSLAVGGGMLLPDKVDAQVSDAQATPAASASPQVSRTAEATSRSSQRPAIDAKALVGAAGNVQASKATASAKPSAKATPSAKASPSAKATAKAATPTRSTQQSTSRSTARSAISQLPALGEVVGNRYTTTGVNIRTAPSTDARKLTTLAEGEKVRVTSVRSDGWRQVKVDGRAGWVRQAYLTTTKPQPSSEETSSASGTSSKPSSSTSSRTSSTSSKRRSSSSPSSASSTTRVSTSSARSTSRSDSGGSCSSYAVENGLTSNAVAVHRAVCANFPSIKNFGGQRASADNHGSGRALDVMVTGSTGWAVAEWARANASSLGITEVIFSQKIWTTQRSGEGWRSMSDRGSTTANHYDHVHISVR